MLILKEDKILEKKELWFVARTIGCVELRMREYLKKIPVDCFVPTEKKIALRKGEMTEVETPIVHNLIFFKTNYTLANYIFSLNSRRMHRIFDEKGLLFVPEKQMDLFISFVNEYYGKVKILDSNYVVGDKMMIKKGPFAGLIGKVVRIDNKSYFTVSLERLLVAAVKLPKSNLMKVEDTV